MNRRDANRLLMLGATGLLAQACGSIQSPASPTLSARLEPWGEEVSEINGTKAVLVYSGYAESEMRLMDALRQAGLDPRLRQRQTFGNQTYEVGPDMTEFGWVFLVQNSRIGELNESVTLSRDHLWAAYRKLAVG